MYQVHASGGVREFFSDYAQALARANSYLAGGMLDNDEVHEILLDRGVHHFQVLNDGVIVPGFWATIYLPL